MILREFSGLGSSMNLKILGFQIFLYDNGLEERKEHQQKGENSAEPHLSVLFLWLACIMMYHEYDWNVDGGVISFSPKLFKLLLKTETMMLFYSRVTNLGIFNGVHKAWAST